MLLHNWANRVKKNIANYSFFIVAITSAFLMSCNEQSTSPQQHNPSYFCQYNGYTYSNYNDYLTTCIAPASSATESFYCQYNGYTYSNYADFLATCVAPPTYFCEINGMTYNDYSSYLTLCTANSALSSSSLKRRSSSSKQFVCDIPRCSSMKDCYSDAVRDAIKNNPRDSDAAYLEAGKKCGCANTQCSRMSCYSSNERNATTAEQKCQLQYRCACYTK